MSTAVGPKARTIEPDGLPLVILILSCILLGISIVTVTLRSYSRFVKGNFGLDDAFVIVGTVVHSAATGLSIYGVLVGLGRRDMYLNAWQESEAMKYYIIWILFYVVALATVKSSICITIIRIASTQSSLCTIIYALLALTWASFFITFIGTHLYCRPVNAIWTPQLIMTGQGKCAPVKTLVIIGHVATVSTIATDLALVVVPGFILWNTQMKTSAKWQAFGLLSFASVASVVTMVRIPYVNKFEALKDLPFWVAHTMLCSNIETGIGCIASSLPSLRYLFRHPDEDGNSGPSNNKKGSGTNKSFFTIGSEPRDRRFGDKSLLDSHAEGGISGGVSLTSFHHSGPDDRWEHPRDGDPKYHCERSITLNEHTTTKGHQEPHDLERQQRTTQSPNFHAM